MGILVASKSITKPRNISFSLRWRVAVQLLSRAQLCNPMNACRSPLSSTITWSLLDVEVTTRSSILSWTRQEQYGKMKNNLPYFNGKFLYSKRQVGSKGFLWSVQKVGVVVGWWPRASPSLPHYSMPPLHTTFLQKWTGIVLVQEGSVNLFKLKLSAYLIMCPPEINNHLDLSFMIFFSLYGRLQML